MKTPNEDAIGQSLELDVSLIDFDPRNRKDHDKAKLQSLADAIKSEGLLEPIIVRSDPTKAGRYRLVAGERRLRACQLLKHTKIAARVLRESNDLDAAKKRLVENGQREDLTAIEEARGFRELNTEHKISQEEVGRLAGGKSQSYVANSLRLLELPGEVQELVQKGELTRAHGIALVRFARWKKTCEAIALQAVKERTSSKDLEDRGIPFEYLLARQKQIVKVTGYRGYGVPDYSMPAQLQKDPDFMKVHSDWYCFAPEKWAPEQKRQDAEFAKRAKSQEKAEGTRQSKMSPAQKAERKKKIATNRKNREDSTAATVAALAHLKGVKTVYRGIVAAVVSKLFTDGHYAFVLKEAAKQISLSIPAGLVTNSYRSRVSVPKLLTLSETDMLRLAAASIVQYHGEQAVKFSHQPPDEVTAIVPKGRKGKAK